MVKRILVPLDETTDHESILPLVADLARGAGATVRLLHVAPVPDNVVDVEGRIVAYSDQEMSRLQSEWRDYLDSVQFLLGGVPAEPAFRFGDPVEQILAEAADMDADLIAVTTVCRSGVKRALLGSVAEQVVKRARTSVLLLRPMLAA